MKNEDLRKRRLDLLAAERQLDKDEEAAEWDIGSLLPPPEPPQPRARRSVVKEWRVTLALRLTPAEEDGEDEIVVPAELKDSVEFDSICFPRKSVSGVYVDGCGDSLVAAVEAARANCARVFSDWEARLIVFPAEFPVSPRVSVLRHFGDYQCVYKWNYRLQAWEAH